MSKSHRPISGGKLVWPTIRNTAIIYTATIVHGPIFCLQLMKTSKLLTIFTGGESVRKRVTF